jgi:hypothetical protein
LQLAEYLITALIRPNTTTYKPGVAIHKRNHLRAESDAGAVRAREQHRPAQVQNRGTTFAAQ